MDSEVGVDEAVAVGEWVDLETTPQEVLDSFSASIPHIVRTDPEVITAKERQKLLEPRGEIRLPATWDMAIWRGQVFEWLYGYLHQAGNKGVTATTRRYFLADARRTMVRWWRAWSYVRWWLSQPDTPEAIDAKNHQCAQCEKLVRTDDGMHCSVCGCAVKAGTDIRVKNGRRYGHCQLGIHAGSKRRPWHLPHCASGRCGKSEANAGRVRARPR